MEFDLINEIVEEKSKFIAYIKLDFLNIEELKEIIDSLRKEHKKARHICYAYVVKKDGIELKRYNDDGEPKGTAGIPILSTIETFNKENILVIIVRYFGGKKLGASKLLRTYRRAAKEALENIKE